MALSTVDSGSLVDHSQDKPRSPTCSVMVTDRVSGMTYNLYIWHDILPVQLGPGLAPGHEAEQEHEAESGCEQGAPSSDNHRSLTSPESGRSFISPPGASDGDGAADLG